MFVPAIGLHLYSCLFGETYLVPAGMYASQVRGAEYVKWGQLFQVRHMSLLKGTLGEKLATAD